MSNRRQTTRRAVTEAKAAAIVTGIREQILSTVPAGATLDPALLDRFLAYWTSRSVDDRHLPSERIGVMGVNCFNTDHLVVVEPGSCVADDEDELEEIGQCTWAEFFASGDLGQEFRDYFDDDEDDEERFPPDEPFDPDYVRDWLADQRSGSSWQPQVVMGDLLPKDVLEAFADFAPAIWCGDFCEIAVEDADAVALALADRGWLIPWDQGMTDLSMEPFPAPDEVRARLSWYYGLRSIVDDIPRIRGAQPTVPAPLKASAALQQCAINLAAPDLKPKVLELQAQGVLEDPGVTAALLTGRRALEKLMQPSPLERAAQATMKAHGLSREEYDGMAKIFGG